MNRVGLEGHSKKKSVEITLLILHGDIAVVIQKTAFVTTNLNSFSQSSSV